MPQLLRLASRVFNTPLLVLPATALTIAAVIAGRSGLETEDFGALAGGFAPEASRFVGTPQGARDAEGDLRWAGYNVTPDGVGIVPIVGELVNRGAYVGASSGLVSYEGVQQQLRAAAGDPKVNALLLDLQSPGGEAVGAMETAAAVRAIAATMPVVAVVNGMAASAAYAIASGASEIWTVPTGISGSIGVVMLHVDQSEKLAKAGVKPTLIFAGDHKVDGHSLGPLPDGVQADMQAKVDQFYGLFVDAVAAGRPGMDADAIRATQARTFIGQAAVDVGLADHVGTFDDALASLKARRSSAIPAATPPAATPKGSTMSDTPPNPPIDAAAERHAAAAAERERVKAITSCEEAKGREDLAAHFAFDTAMSAEDAKKALARSPKSDAFLNAMGAAPAPKLGAGGGEAAAGGAAAAVEKPRPMPEASAVYAARREAADKARR